MRGGCISAMWKRDAIARGDTKQVTKTGPRGLRRVSGGEGTATRAHQLRLGRVVFTARTGLALSQGAQGFFLPYR